MGTGIQACKESEMVIELIERFLETGFRKDTALQMMNAAMVLQGEDGMFSTVDMAAIDQYTGVCQCCKIGAATTFIKRGSRIETISGGSLPAGIYPQVEPEHSTVALQDGDFVILVSDGVLDYLHVPSPEETVKEILETIQINNPEKLAGQLLERILLFTGGRALDDMTVLAAGIWER
jgi:stage II sporulation protein E